MLMKKRWKIFDFEHKKLFQFLIFNKIFLWKLFLKIQ